MSSWLDKVIVSKAVIKSKGDDKQKAQYKGKKKKKGKKGPNTKASYHCGTLQTNTYKGVTYCSKCHKSV